MYGMMYSPDKMMMNPKPLGPPAIGGTNCFTGRYSPTYRVPEQMRDPMRRCMTNPPVSIYFLWNVLHLIIFLIEISKYKIHNKIPKGDYY